MSENKTENKDAVYDFSMSNFNLPSWWGDESREFGYFSADGREYVITDYETPRPWLNYLGNDEYGLVFGNHGEGFSWYRSMTSRVSRYTSQEYVPREPDSGRAVYFRFEGDKKLTSLVSGNADDYRCVHGLGYSEVSGSVCGVDSKWRVFVPKDDPVEIWQLEVVNNSDSVKEFEVLPVIEWQLGMHGYEPPCRYEPLSDIERDLSGWFDDEAGCVVVKNRADQPMDYSGFFKSLDDISGWECRRSALRGGSILDLEDAKIECMKAENERCVSVFSVSVCLEPGQKRVLNFAGGVFEKDCELKGLVEKYSDQGVCDRAFCDLKKSWDVIVCDNVFVDTPDETVNLWTNVRLKHLNQITKRWTRGLDRGYRDILQDLRGYVLIDPSEVRKYFLETLRYQYSDGRGVRQWSEVGTNHDLRDYSDSPVWMADVLTTYVKETGDFDILEEEVEFFGGGKASVYEHLLRGIWYLYENRGEHGLCLIRYGDWNDALEGIGREGRAEGVWLSMALYWAMELSCELAKEIGDAKQTSLLGEAKDTLKRNINEHGWTGRWYAYAIDDDGNLIGSQDEPEGKLHLNPQSFAIFTGVADDERVGIIKAAVEEHLMTDIGPLLVWPGYQNYEVGRIWRMEPGTFENGSMYFHGAAFKIIADIESGDPDSAIDTFLKILPSNPSNCIARSTIEPYALGNFYCGSESEFFGTNLYSHFTGSYSWLSKAIVEKMLGVEAGYGGLRVNPKLPLSWDRASVVRHYRGKKYQVEIQRQESDLLVFVNGERY